MKTIFFSFWHSDINYFKLIEAWGLEETYDCKFHANLFNSECTEYDLSNISKSGYFVLLASEQTKYSPMVNLEIKAAIESSIPIIVINTNGARSLDFDLCPIALQHKLALHIGLSKFAFAKAILEWEDIFQVLSSTNQTGDYYFSDNAYKP